MSTGTQQIRERLHTDAAGPGGGGLCAPLNQLSKPIRMQARGDGRQSVCPSEPAKQAHQNQEMRESILQHCLLIYKHFDCGCQWQHWRLCKRSITGRWYQRILNTLLPSLMVHRATKTSVGKSIHGNRSSLLLFIQTL